jgi:predicted ATPase/DNA-binding CsgD family transcriptional regulator
MDGALFGRERETSVLTEMLTDPAIRLVTVTGPAGVGKTRVADAVADRMEQNGTLRIVRVELGPLGEPALVADAVAAAAGAWHRARIASALEAAASALAAGPTLLVLDNFEHLAAAAPDVAKLLDACPGLTALVTSRHVLGLSSEHMYPLAPLALPGPEESGAAETARFASVALFVARACARDPSFELTEDVAPAVAEICRRLDGLPLAIELVAARAGVLPPPALVARWEDAVGLDMRGAHDLPSRQQTLRQALDWSYDLLEPDEQALLRRLAAFSGGFGLASVEAACAGAGASLPRLDLQPMTALAGLVDRSLVEREGGSTSEPRYRQLVTVRGYLREQLAAQDELVAADRLMADVVADVARRSRLFGLSREALDDLERELNNFHAAFDVFLRTEPARAAELATDLFGLWRTRRAREGREWVERSLSAAEGELTAAARSRALWAAGMLACYQGDMEALRRFAAESLAAARDSGDRLLFARAVYAEATALNTVDPAQAPGRFREGLALLEEIGDLAIIAASCNNLGALASEAGDLDEAGAYFERAHRLWRELGDATGVARTAHNLAWIMLVRGDLRRAGDLLFEALAQSSDVGNRHLRAFALAAVTILATSRAKRPAAAVLHGATQGELEAAGVVLEPLEEAAFREAGSALSAVIGAEQFAAASARGRALGTADQQRLVERTLGPGQTPEASPLTRRELEVVRLMAAGLTNAEIAEQLVLSDHTVHRHVANILRKLDVRSRAAAASLAAQLGLL